MSRVRVVGLFLLSNFRLVSTALQAQPAMEVSWTNFLAEYDNLNRGLERVFIYTIRNTSPDGATNANMFYRLRSP